LDSWRASLATWLPSVCVIKRASLSSGIRKGAVATVVTTTCRVGGKVSVSTPHDATFARSGGANVVAGREIEVPYTVDLIRGDHLVVTHVVDGASTTETYRFVDWIAHPDITYTFTKIAACQRVENL
jgi:hypothetical protein